MLFTIQDKNLKIFASALRCLTRLGKREIYLGPKPEVLCLQSLNASHSAHGLFKFPKNFFTKYDYDKKMILDTETKHFHCKVSAKAAQALVHSLTVTKHIESCTFNIRKNKPIKVVLQYQNKIIKVQIVSVLEWEMLELDPTPDEDIPNQIQANAKQFIDAFVSFYSSQNDISLTMMSRTLLLQNYVDESQVTKRERRTEVRLMASEFLMYVLNEPTKITFSLKDWRVVLAFARTCLLPVSIRFGSPASPFVCEISKEWTFESTFAFSTMKPVADVDDSNCSTRTTISAPKDSNPKSKRSAATFNALQKKKEELLRKQQAMKSNVSSSNESFVRPAMFNLPSTSSKASANNINGYEKVADNQVTRTNDVDAVVADVDTLQIQENVYHNDANFPTEGDERISSVTRSKTDSSEVCLKRKLDSVSEPSDAQTVKKARIESELTHSQMANKLRNVFKHCFEHD